MSQTVETSVPRKEVTGLKRMTEKGLRDLCKKDKLYQTPRLNDVLYLHYQGYQYIECLEEYTELKCLWLECNAISEIEGLDKQAKLKCLFLQNNLIKRIDNLASCPELDTLNLSSNHIRKIENISSDILPVLNTLNISSNYLKDSESLAHLVQCKTLAVVDLSNNRIDDILVVKIFEQMPCLKVLVLQGNPVVSRLPQYRKTLILACKELTYLDSRPVFPRDRACAEAWKKDGYEGERKENSRWNRADRKKMRDSVNYTIKLRNRHRPADQQDALISSTDSETEQDADKRAENSRLKADIEYGCVDDIWSEVEGDKKDDDSSASAASGDEQESTRRPLDGRPKKLYESQLPEAENNVEQLNKEQQEQQRGRRVLIEEIKLESLDIEKEKNEMQDEKIEKVKQTEEKEDIEKIELQNKERKNIELEFDEIKRNDVEKEIKQVELKDEERKSEETEYQQIKETVLKDQEIKTEESKEEALLKVEDDQNETHLKDLPDFIPEPDSEEDLGSVTDLEQSSQALAAAIKSNPVDPTPEEIKQQFVDDMYKHYTSEIFVKQPESIDNMLEGETLNYELDPKVCCVEPRKTKDDEEDDKENHVAPKTKQQLDYEAECAGANEKVAFDLEELSNNLDEDLEELIQSVKQLHEEHEGLKSEERFRLDEDEEQEEKEMKEKCVQLTTMVRSLRIVEEFSVRRERISQDQKKQQGKELTNAIEETKTETVKELVASKQEISDGNDDDDDMDIAFAKILDESTDDVPKRVFGAGHDTPSYKWQREECMRQLTLTAVRTELQDEDEYQVKPLTNRTSAEEAQEICDQMSKKLAADEENLRELLQQIEDEVEVLYDIQSTAEEDDLTKVPEPDLVEVCTSLIDELIDELQYQEIINGQDIKCFDFGLIESDEEYSYSADPKVDSIVPIDLQDPASGKSLRECLDAFDNFLSSVKERKRKDKRDIITTSSSEKVDAAKKLLKKRMLPDCSAEELDAQLAKMEEKTKRRVAELTTRCFAKRENLEDSLEVVDNRLVIVKKDTGEMKDLPPPPELISDTDSESESDSSDDDDAYNTADDELHPISEDMELLTARSTDSRRLWAKPCQPERKELQQNNDLALEDINENDNVADQSLDQFYSLEARSAFNSLDTEFLEKLDLKKIIDNDGEITVEGMQDFMEMQANEKMDSPPNEQCFELLEEDVMLKNLIDRKRAQEERERQLKELTDSQDFNPIKQKLKSTEEQLLTIAKVDEDNVKELQDVEPQVHMVSNLRELSAKVLRKVDKNPADSGELKWEQEKPEYQLREMPNPDEMGSIKLTLGSCKLYERKSQLTTIPGDDDDPEVKPKTEEINIDNKYEEKPVEQSAEDKSSVESTTIQILSSSIDDDIVSDTSTDYESGEDIPVVEPPKLPDGALNELFSNQFEDGLKLERESEEALRKELFSLPLRQWASQEQDLNVSQTSEVSEILDMELSDTTIQNSPCTDMETNDMTNSSDLKSTKSIEDEGLSSSDTETEGAIGELQRNAKLQWAKISQTLNDFINADEMKLLEAQEFNENNDNVADDDELIEDLATLHEVDEDIFKECETEFKDFHLESECKLGNVHINPTINDTSVKKTIVENDKKEQNKLNSTESEEAEEQIPGDQSKQPSNAKPTIRLEYFEAIDPDKDGADFDESAELKTDQIQCNLEILNDDGDAVVKEVNVNAQVTYEFQ
ncbi:dynein assembly factor 1, axonemal homolog [Drosophila innubila]|uniref:dynein assembly factor 1, axonemal homolog n=1 Tax=Drosophila innubila TaxID=198719 RepID=UPI00148B7109|nr:dynein assembly factor 1, axonemal homolog [Drosophila innubila]